MVPQQVASLALISAADPVQVQPAGREPALGAACREEPSQLCLAGSRRHRGMHATTIRRFDGCHDILPAIFKHLMAVPK